MMFILVISSLFMSVLKAIGHNSSVCANPWL